MPLLRFQPVPIADLKLFRRIIAREDDVLVDSYSRPGTGKISDDVPAFIHREHREMVAAVRKLDRLIGDKKKGGR